ncbi:MAG TPA: serine hydrolase domain-containing protein [Mycobacteriales bacterium]|nr:serine hydrolase domain-containing protein [Mycobacteriales bacterium]
MNESLDGRRMRRGWRAPVAVTAVLAAVCAAGGGAVSAAADPGPRDRAGYGQSDLQRDLDAITATGVTGALAEVDLGRRRLTGHAGVADVTTGRPVAEDGYFRIGSQTKTFVAVALLQLVGERRLALDDTVDRWLPGVVAGNGNDGRAITIRQLLQHTSGLYDYTNDLADVIGSADAFRQRHLDHVSPQDLVAIAMRHQPEFAPGTAWNYSNTNYIVAGMVIEKVTGRTWSQQVSARILGPLGMTHTSAPGDRPYLPRPHAQGYNEFPEGGPLVDTTIFNTTWGDAAGGMVSTTADLTRFWRALQGGALLRPAEQAQLHRTVLATTFQDIVPGGRYGLGIMWLPLSCGGGYWAHDGDVPGFATFDGASDNGRRSVVLSLSTRLASADPFRKSLDLLDHALCATG